MIVVCCGSLNVLIARVFMVVVVWAVLKWWYVSCACVQDENDGIIVVVITLKNIDVDTLHNWDGNFVFGKDGEFVYVPFRLVCTCGGDAAFRIRHVCGNSRL